MKRNNFSISFFMQEKNSSLFPISHSDWLKSISIPLAVAGRRSMWSVVSWADEVTGEVSLSTCHRQPVCLSLLSSCCLSHSLPPSQSPHLRLHPFVSFPLSRCLSLFWLILVQTKLLPRKTCCTKEIFFSLDLNRQSTVLWEIFKIFYIYMPQKL